MYPFVGAINNDPDPASVSIFHSYASGLTPVYALAPTAAEITNSYYLTYSDTPNGGRSKFALLRKETYDEWDFEEIWAINDLVSFPSLRNLRNILPDQALQWPTDSGEVTLWYGQLDSLSSQLNSGYDIQGGVGDNVYAVEEGTIVALGTDPVHGNFLSINFEFNYENYQYKL
jgi:murein DD-endopeptidase MepM/ murein hydrolase activator NlpD